MLRYLGDLSELDNTTEPLLHQCVQRNGPFHENLKSFGDLVPSMPIQPGPYESMKLSRRKKLKECLNELDWQRALN